ncbi:glycosyltransferase [Candidatus Dojkabacteria bacterium]|nr:glycosyltransferase [Candidatus Dojkabacteria bacterium]
MIRYLMANDPSGYGAAARNDVHALYVSGVPITTEIIKQMGENTDYGISGLIANALQNRDIDYKIKILHLTPDLYPRYIEDGIFNIGRLFWETDRLPKEWVQPCNLMQEIWTASESMAKMITDSGVTTPVRWFPQPIDTSKLSERIQAFETQYPKDFTFYSIFQWIMRKNPRTLLRAYWKEFEGNDAVTLLLKTYRVTYQPSEYELIKGEIQTWKNELKLDHYPKIYLVDKLLKDSEIYRLHKMGDCFIQPSSGEGWSRPTQEAMLMGKPVISGNNGGITDYLTPYHYYKVESKSVQATMQSFIPWYVSEMSWKELDEDSLREQMRIVYNEHGKAEKTAKKAQDYVCENLSLDKVGQLMFNRITEIYGEFL